MVKQIEQMKKERLRNGCIALTQNSAPSGANHSKFNTRIGVSGSYEVIALHVSPDLGERILLSADRSILDEVFPETNQAVLDARSGVAWNQFEGRQVIRFPLNGYCKLNSIQVLTRLLNAGFTVEASTGGGADSQQFSEYLLVRKHLM
jgi:BTB/POZ domain-containing protein KCTD1/15